MGEEKEIKTPSHEKEQSEEQGRNNLFEGLPLPSSNCEKDDISKGNAVVNAVDASDQPKPPYSLPQAPKKGALKKRPSQAQTEDESPPLKDAAKRVKFRTTVDASTQQIIDAMQKIATHIGNPAKFCKASKLALQLIQAKSVTSETCGCFFHLLQSSMLSPTSCNDPSLRAAYHELFSAVQDIAGCFTKQQQKQLESWILRAYVANDLHTDDSFVFSKASARIRQAIDSLPEASEGDDMYEETLLSDCAEQDSSAGNTAGKEEMSQSTDLSRSTDLLEKQDLPGEDCLNCDPFGLDALLSKTSKGEEKLKRKMEERSSDKGSQDDTKKFLMEKREALMQCLRIASGRYKVPWAQTMIDILAKHAFDNISKFTSQQRHAIEKLWTSIRDQQIRRKQGKSATENVDITGFERLQRQYASQKISIRHPVGGGGDRRAETWLG